MSANTELATVPPAETALAVYSKPNGLDPWLDQVRAKVDEFKKVLPDLKTRKGREAYASMAHSIAKSKTALEAVGKEISAKQKEIPKLIDAERKRVWDTLEAWQKEVRKPLDDWQAAEDKRVQDHNDSIQRIKDLALFTETPSAAHVAQIIADLELVSLDESWEEFLAEAAQVKDQVLAKLRTLHDERARHEAERAELARLRQEAEARAQADRDAEIAREAAERAQREAEDRARADREEAAKREQALIDAAQREKQDAENQRLQLQLQAEQAERQRVEAEQRAEQERVDAERRQAEAVERAKQEEIDRQKAAADEILRQQQERERDKAHRRSINRAALDAFIAGGMTEECARQAITLIAERKIPNIAISY